MSHLDHFYGALLRLEILGSLLLHTLLVPLRKRRKWTTLHKSCLLFNITGLLVQTCHHPSSAARTGWDSTSHPMETTNWKASVLSIKVRYFTRLSWARCLYLCLYDKTLKQLRGSSCQDWRDWKGRDGESERLDICQTQPPALCKFVFPLFYYIYIYIFFFFFFFFFWMNE